jgi:hypothetical protein
VETETGEIARFKIGDIWLWVFCFDYLLHFPFPSFVLFFCCFCYWKTSGASSPEWVKPTAEGGGICFSVDVFPFRNLQFCFMFVVGFVFVYIATMADGR